MIFLRNSRLDEKEVSCFNAYDLETCLIFLKEVVFLPFSIFSKTNRKGSAFIGAITGYGYGAVHF